MLKKYVYGFMALALAGSFLTPTFANAAASTITNVSPVSGTPGSTVTIRGSGFSTLNLPMGSDQYGDGVWLTNGSYSMGMNVTVQNDSTMTATISSGLCPGTEPPSCSSNFETQITPGGYSIYIKSNNGQNVSNKFPFTVVTLVSGPNISNIAPQSGPAGTFLDIFGSGFSSLNLPAGGDQYGDGIWFTNGNYSMNMYSGPKSIQSDNTITVVTPTGLCPGNEANSCSSNFQTQSVPAGNYSVYIKSNNGQNVSNKISFTVMPTGGYLTMNGNSTVQPGVANSYSVIDTNPNVGTFTYTFNWGDGTQTTSPAGYAAGTSYNASHTWATAGNYLIVVIATPTSGTPDKTTLNVQVGTGASTTSIQITSPAGGEQWVIGTTQTIRWTPPQGAPTVVISLQNNVSSSGCQTMTCQYNSGAKSYLITTQGSPAPNTGSFTWTVGSGTDQTTNAQGVPAGTYSVTVQALNAGGNSQGYPSGTSNWFTVVSSSVTPAPTPTPTMGNINLPDGTVIKLPNSPTVYLVTGGQLQPFTSAQDFLNKGYTWSQVQQISPSQVPSTSGFYPYPSGSLVNDGGTVYFVSGHTKVPFTNYQAFVGLGYSFGNVIQGDLTSYPLSSSQALTNFNMAHPWGSWLIYQGTVYYSSQNGLIGVPSGQIFTSNGGNWNLLVKANSYDMAASSLSPMTLNDSRVTQ